MNVESVYERGSGIQDEDHKITKLLFHLHAVLLVVLYEFSNGKIFIHFGSTERRNENYLP